METLIYSLWRRCFTFFEGGQDGRVQPPFKKGLRLAKENNYAFPQSHLISVSLSKTRRERREGVWQKRPRLSRTAGSTRLPKLAGLLYVAYQPVEKQAARARKARQIVEAAFALQRFEHLGKTTLLPRCLEKVQEVLFQHSDIKMWGEFSERRLPEWESSL